MQVGFNIVKHCGGLVNQLLVAAHLHVQVLCRHTNMSNTKAQSRMRVYMYVYIYEMSKNQFSIFA
jgi:hypothetical protein